MWKNAYVRYSAFFLLFLIPLVLFMHKNNLVAIGSGDAIVQFYPSYTYLGVEIGTCEHEIELKYHTPMLLEGKIVSGLSFVMLASAVLWYNRRRVYE